MRWHQGRSGGVWALDQGWCPFVSRRPARRLGRSAAIGRDPCTSHAVPLRDSGRRGRNSTDSASPSASWPADQLPAPILSHSRKPFAFLSESIHASVPVDVLAALSLQLGRPSPTTRSDARQTTLRTTSERSAGNRFCATRNGSARIATPQTRSSSGAGTSTVSVQVPALTPKQHSGQA
jgi:hypothetical protein